MSASPLTSIPFDVFEALTRSAADEDILALSLTCRKLWGYADEHWRRSLATNPNCPPYLLTSLPSSSSSSSPASSLTSSRLYFGLKHPRVYSWGPHAEQLLNIGGTAETLSTKTVDAITPVELTSRFMRHPPLVGIADVGTRLVATDAAGSVWEWDRSRGMPGRPTRLWLTEPVAEIATGPGEYVVRDVQGNVWALERQNLGPRRIAILPATQVAAGNSVMAALCGGEIWVWYVERVPIGVLDEERDDPVPAKLAPPPRREEWRGWRADGDGPRTNRAAFERQWVERGGEPGRCSGNLSTPSSPSCPTSASSASSDHDPDDAERIVRIACGWNDVVALKANGEVWISWHSSWDFLSHFSRPDNYDVSMNLSTLAVFTASDPWPHLATHNSRGTNPHPPHAMWLGPRPSDRVVGLAMGRDHCIALSQAGKVYSWGSAERSLLGRPAGGTNVAAARIMLHDDWAGGREEPFVVDVCGSAALALGDGCPPRRRGTASSHSTAPQPVPKRGLWALLKMFWQ
ncbi:hypothetical protein CcaverHIS641_0108800 [Cutaneotrichosporon cavernicola]|nr:hypothetical protein CcaverHIS641_0108800 [Cutaneotrichosporon cavernicola]